MVVKKSSAVLTIVAVAVVFYILGSFVGLPFVDGNLASGDVGVAKSGDSKQDVHWYDRLKESVVTGRVPKKLKTFDPFWGVPQPFAGNKEDYKMMDDCAVFRLGENAFPKWIAWNLDLASDIPQRYKFDRFTPEGWEIPCREQICSVIDECYRWAWRKPYGNTSVVMGPLFSSKDLVQPYAYFVAVCKQERIKTEMPLDFTSLAYVIPVDGEKKDVYDYALSVNAVEQHSGYNLFCKLPASVQDMVEELTDYEILCSFQEFDEDKADSFKPEREQGDYVDDPAMDR